ncbi:uncharacterized protein J3D65DRAFT_362567 [Phyllosticta citribraziliensis]|uniref:Uncharacterized protein n=1 Tax=Phyllosticta citribraziliensis TaxID=989973 RepID=A0ABR1LQQ3_9PEZI
MRLSFFLIYNGSLRLDWSCSSGVGSHVVGKGLFQTWIQIAAGILREGWKRWSGFARAGAGASITTPATLRLGIGASDCWCLRCRRPSPMYTYEQVVVSMSVHLPTCLSACFFVYTSRTLAAVPLRSAPRCASSFVSSTQETHCGLSETFGPPCTITYTTITITAAAATAAAACCLAVR